jgi:Phospholipase B
MKRFPHCLAVSLGVVVCLIMSRPAGAEGPAPRPGLTPTQEAWLKHAQRRDQNGWVFLHVEGSPAERGFQHGYLLAGDIAESLRVRRALWEHDTSMTWQWLVEKAGAMLGPKVDPENRDELDGIVAGLAAAGVPSSRNELIAHNAYFELAWYWWPTVKASIGAKAPQAVPESCSSFIATGHMTRDGGIVLGHNSMVDFPEADLNLILDVAPEHGSHILMQSVPGWVHSGSDFFVTSAGLVGSETTLGGFEGYDEKGVPEFCRMRRATQDATSIDQWCDIMKKGNNGGYANAWLLGNVNTGQIARLEMGLKYPSLEKKNDGYFVGSNVPENLKILRLETGTNESDIRLSSVARRVRWKKLMSRYEGKIDLAAAKAFESDHYDAYREKDFPGGHSLCGHFELDRLAFGDWPGAPYYPAGTIDGKVIDSTMAKQMRFVARWGAACGTPFDSRMFLEAHPQFDWMQGLLKDRPTQPWTEFRAVQADK